MVLVDVTIMVTFWEYIGSTNCIVGTFTAIFRIQGELLVGFWYDFINWCGTH